MGSFLEGSLRCGWLSGGCGNARRRSVKRGVGAGPAPCQKTVGGGVGGWEVQLSMWGWWVLQVKGTVEGGCRF